MAKKETALATQSLFGDSINPERPYLIINFNTHGNLGKTTEEKRFLEFYQALMGRLPVIISADPTEPKVMRQNYGQRDSDNILLPEDQQELGKGVVEIDVEDKDGQLANLLADAIDMGRDVLVDTKGGSLDALAKNWGGSLVGFFNNFAYYNIIWIVPFVNDHQKDIGNLNSQYQFLTNDPNNQELYADITMLHVFSEGKIGNDKKVDLTMKAVAQWEEKNQFPSSVRTTKAIFKTNWADREDISELFRDREIRQIANQKKPDDSRMLAQQFLNEGDMFWAKFLLTQEQLEEIAFKPHPIPYPNPNRTRLWGKTLFTRDEMQSIADSKQDLAEKEKWLNLLKS
ncbi:hypothetical protein K6L09_20990 [Burkholderia cepacia]